MAHTSQPFEGLEPQSREQMLSQELAAAQGRLWEYTKLISNLYAELETIRNLVCYTCKERISSANLAQQTHDVGREQIAPVISPWHTTAKLPVPFPLPPPDGHNAPTNLPNIRQENSDLSASTSIPVTLSRPAAIANVSTPSEPTEPFFTPPETPIAESLENNAVISEPIIQNSPWSIVYNTETKQSLSVAFVHEFKHSSPVYGVQFSPDGNLLAAGVDTVGSACIYDVKARSTKCTLAEYPGYYKENSRTHDIRCVCFSPDGRCLAVADTSEVYIWKIASKRVLATLKGHEMTIRSLDISIDGRLLVTGSFDNSLRIWKIRDGSSKLLSIDDGTHASVRFSPNGRYVAAANSDRCLRIWDVRSGHLIRKWRGHTSNVQCLAFSPDGERLVSGGWDNIVKWWDVGPLRLPASDLSAEERVLESYVLPLKSLELSGSPFSLAISPDGKWVIVGSDANLIHICDMNAAVPQCILQGHSRGIVAVHSSPVANYIAAGSMGGSMTLWKYKML